MLAANEVGLRYLPTSVSRKHEGLTENRLSKDKLKNNVVIGASPYLLLMILV